MVGDARSFLLPRRNFITCAQTTDIQKMRLVNSSKTTLQWIYLPRIKWLPIQFDITYWTFLVLLFSWLTVAYQSLLPSGQLLTNSGHCKGRFTHSMPCPCHAHAVPMPCPCRAHAMLWPCRSPQGHGTARPSRDGLWTTCPRSASSGYHAEFHEDCCQKHTNPPHNDPYLRL